jgi:hypothetical protein
MIEVRKEGSLTHMENCKERKKERKKEKACQLIIMHGML